MYIISKCLLGYNCKYNGGNNLNKNVVEFAQSHTHYLVCPETTGGLPSPRVPSEQVATSDGSFRVIAKTGEEVTDFFVKGAKLSLERAFEAAKDSGELIEGAILKARSPSCGHGEIYDGTFSGVKTEGNGVFAEMLEDVFRSKSVFFEDSFRIMTEEDL